MSPGLEKASPPAGRWSFWIDRGGTFTDCVGRDPATGRLHVVKVLSSDRAPLTAIRRMLGLNDDDAIAACDVRMGTTLATNALLERRGERCALVTTAGLGDLLTIGTQQRPDLFALTIEKPEVLPERVLEIEARCDPAGNPLSPLDTDAVRAALQTLRDAGLISAAVVLLGDYTGGVLEREVGALAEEAGFDHVALSHEISPEIGMLARAETTVTDAYLTPILRRYLAVLARELPGSQLRLMQSSGGLVGAERFRGPNAILSGPAAGAVASAHLARQCGVGKVVGFDMGGTSTDVSRWGGELERVYETQVSGIRLRVPMIDIHTVAAGGGSICRHEGGRFIVGPKSAGAVPGPLCYGHEDATELTVTDVNLVLGRLVPDRFPMALEARRARLALEEIATRLPPEAKRTSEEVAWGFFEVANATMAEAIRQVSVARGHDVRDHALVVFGGAGGQHACALARRLGIRHILCHPLGGVLSAYGMGCADVRHHLEADLGRLTVDASLDGRLEPIWNDLTRQARLALEAEGFDPADMVLQRRIDLRYRGTETALTISFGGDLRVAFEAEHLRAFGYARPEHPIEAAVARVEGIGKVAAPSDPPWTATAPPGPMRTAKMWTGGGEAQAPVYARESLRPNDRLEGPALIVESVGTLAVDEGFALRMDDRGVIHLTEVRTAAADADSTSVDPVRLEIFANRFMSIAEQMGSVLRRTALSTNIRERLDFSCAIFDDEGGLVANAPHIPVHLGAMGETVRAVRAAFEVTEPGDVFACNAPYAGGSHLPDITVVRPIHDPVGAVRFYAAARGHHADIGGTTPGSMPPDARRLEDEGVVIEPTRIVHRGALDAQRIRYTLLGAPHPARDPDTNLADIEAQIAATRTGHALIEELVAEQGLAMTRAYMGHVQDNAAMVVAEAIASLGNEERTFRDALDDGVPIAVTLRKKGALLEIDFAGTGPQTEGNLNAPPAVTLAAVIYVLRALVGRPIPLNAGCLRNVRVITPPHSVLSPDRDRAVAGGNVETSQRVVDVLLGAFGAAAASQGTMNNLTFGNERFGYYETIGGGAGATPEAPGRSGIHTHMTNTRITDPEVLEARFPVRLLEFSLRAGSGGGGLHRGGDGLVRELELLRPLWISILSERRVRAPFGLAGGEPGAVGRNLLNGRPLPGRVSIRAQAGDRLRIETPGGGGWGAPP